MRSKKRTPRINIWLAALAALAVGCAVENAASQGVAPTDVTAAAPAPAPPWAVRTGQADFAVAPVESEVSAGEVLVAVQRILAASPLCMTWPSLWVETQIVRTVRVRYDLMRRDWGGDVVDEGQSRMDAFVEMGFLTKRARDDIAPGVVDYTITDLGRAHMNGSPLSDTPPRFCAPSERQVVAVTQTERGDFPCGKLKVHFTFAPPSHLSWASSESLRASAMQFLDPPAEGRGTLTLSREWFGEGQLPDGMVNGSLQSVCFDNHNRVLGNDLTLAAGRS